MRSVRWLAVVVSAGLASGCGESVNAATSRYTSDKIGTRGSLPVCFPPAPPALGLAERAQYAENVAACADAARAEGVSVVAMRPCLVASATWDSRYTGADVADCGPDIGGAYC